VRALPEGLTMIAFKAVVRESQVEKTLREGVTEGGGKAIKVRFLRGWPDRIVLWPRGVLHFIEMKKPKGSRFEPRQERVHSWLRKMGFKVFVLYTKDQVEQYLNERKKVDELF